MKKIIGTILSVLFVIVAGVFYLCTGPGKASEPEEMTSFADTAEISGQLITDEKLLTEPLEGVSEEKAPEPTKEPVELFVHVCGAVRAPGVYTLTEGARVIDALEAAGGLTEAAAAELLNQAELLVDGTQIYVYTHVEAEELKLAPGQQTIIPAGASSEETGTAGQMVNLNTATLQELMELPGIGQTRAEAILAYRKEHGRFQSIEELMQVSGIKENTFRKLQEHITVD